MSNEARNVPIRETIPFGNTRFEATVDIVPFAASLTTEPVPGFGNKPLNMLTK